MEGAVGEVYFDIDHGEGGEYTFFHGLLDAFFHSGNVLFRNGAANDGVLEFEAAPGLIGFDFEDDVGVLSSTSGLFGVFDVGGGFFRDSFSISHLRSAGADGEVEFVLNAVKDHF